MSGLTELGQVLHEEHFRILVSVCGWENRVTGADAAHPMDPRRAEDKQQLEDLVRALDDVLGHHAFEELVIFPLIRSKGGGELTSALAREHGAIEPMAARLRTITTEILENDTGGHWEAFCEAATQLIAEVMRHLQKEELNVVQRMDRFLDRETDHRLAIQLIAERCADKETGSILRQRREDSDPSNAPLTARRLNPAVAATRNAARRRSTSVRQPSR